jgi:hypothetical protein
MNVLCRNRRAKSNGVDNMKSRIRIGECMQLVRNLLAPLLLSGALLSGAATAQQTAPSNLSLSATLGNLDQAAQTTNLDLAKLRIEKWKADGSVKQGAQHDVDSLERNLSTALPGMTAQARTAPNDVVGLFRLYRTVGAVYDVLSSVAEVAGAFGPKGEYETLAQDVQRFNAARRALGDAVEGAATDQAAQLATVRNALAQAQAVPPEPPKKIVVDDTTPAPAKKPVHKKKPAAKPAAPAAGTQGSAPAASPSAPK